MAHAYRSDQVEPSGDQSIGAAEPLVRDPLTRLSRSFTGADAPLRDIVSELSRGTARLGPAVHGGGGATTVSAPGLQTA
ncbi:hypothetical protein KRMM14A1259_47230 [Krasilnikovia sp. MM14-A1259]